MEIDGYFQYIIYDNTVGEGLAPPEENETKINGFAKYKLYDNFVGRSVLDAP